MITKPPVLLDFPSLFGKLNLTCDVVPTLQLRATNQTLENITIAEKLNH